MDNLTKDFPQAHAFIDDILLVSKSKKIEHISLEKKILKKLDETNASLKLLKCEIAKSSCQWLGHHINNTGITPLDRKTRVIDELKAPRTRRQLKLLMGFLHSLHKFLPKLAEISAPLKPLLSQNNDFIWTNQCETASVRFLERFVASMTELRLFDIHRETRTNVLELLAVVWAIKHYRRNLYGRIFLTVISDRKALLSIVSSSPKGNKTFFRRLTRWYDRLLPYDFKIEKCQGSKMGMVDYISRYPSSDVRPTSEYDSTFKVAKISMINKALNPPKELMKSTKNQITGKFKNSTRQYRTIEGGNSCQYI